MTPGWNGVYGQTQAKAALKTFIDTSKIPHAFLFIGNEGVGKEFTAVEFAKLINRNSPDYNKISRALSSFSEPYVKYIFPLPRGKNETEESGPYEKLNNEEMNIVREQLDSKARNPYYKMSIPRASGIKISSIRDIKKFLSYQYSDITYRIILISDAHTMNEESQNALLKGLEEPPEGIIFILTTPFPGLLRETIRSRCWTVNFHPLDNSEIADILIKHFEVDKKLAETIAPFSGGSVTEAIRLLDSDFEKLLEDTILILRYSFGKKYHSAYSVFEPYLKEAGAAAVKILFSMILIWLNDLQRFRAGSGEMFYKEHKETLGKFNSKFPKVELNEIVSKIEKYISSFRGNINPSILCLSLIFELAALVNPKLTGR